MASRERTCIFQHCAFRHPHSGRTGSHLPYSAEKGVIAVANKVEGPRMVWPDVAKGVCILLVVLWHTVNKHYLQVDWRIGGPVPALWGFVGDQLMTLRMPLFFTISGMFAVSAFHRPWR